MKIFWSRDRFPDPDRIPVRYGRVPQLKANTMSKYRRPVVQVCWQYSLPCEVHFLPVLGGLFAGQLGGET